jgi:hypothetical protein
MSGGKSWGSINVEMHFVADGVSGKTSMYYAFSWRRESVGMFALWAGLSNSRIFDSGFGTVLPGSTSTHPPDGE